MDLTDKQGHILERSFGHVVAPMVAVGRGERRARCSTPCSGILRTGAPWHDLPATIRRIRHAIAGFSSGNAAELAASADVLAEDLRDRGKRISAKHSSTPASAREKGLRRGPYSPVRQQNHGDRDRHGLPVASTCSASPYETTLVEAPSGSASRPLSPQR